MTRISGRQLPRRHRQASPPVRCDAGVQCAIVGWNALTHRFEVMSDLPSPVDEAEFSSQEISHAARPAVVWQSRNVARLFGRDAKQGHTSETETKTKFSRPRMIDANIFASRPTESESLVSGTSGDHSFGVETKRKRLTFGPRLRPKRDRQDQYRDQHFGLRTTLRLRSNSQDRDRHQYFGLDTEPKRFTFGPRLRPRRNTRDQYRHQHFGL